MRQTHHLLYGGRSRRCLWDLNVRVHRNYGLLHAVTVKIYVSAAF